jgi:hypothetical protein
MAKMPLLKSITCPSEAAVRREFSRFWPKMARNASSVAEQIVGAICERLERPTMVALDSIVFFPAPI